MSELDLTWTVDWAIPETLALVPFLLVQVSMVVFILCRGRKDKSFRQAFYVFFVVGTIADCTNVIVVSRIVHIVRIISSKFKFVQMQKGLSVSVKLLSFPITLISFRTGFCSTRSRPSV